MASMLSNYGEEWIQRAAMQDISPTSVECGLYNDSTNALGEGADVADISTEPAGSAYARQSITVPDNVTFSLDGSNNLQVDIDNQTYDTSDSSQTVDSYFLVVNFQATVVSADGSPTDHLVLTGALSQSRDLSQIDNLQVNNMGGTLD
mgnify:CR=1 FL=1